MKLKPAILNIMDRDTLKGVVDELEIEDVDHRNVEDMRAGVARSRRAEPAVLLTHLNEKQVKEVCEQMNVSPKGRRKELIERLLNTTGTAAQTPAKPSLPRSMKTVKPNRKQAQKESPPMADKQNTDNQNNQQPAHVRLPDPPAGMMRVTRTELVWPGKYNEDGSIKEVPRVRLPFQVIETVNETRATREAKKGGIQGGLFDVWEGKEGDSFEDGWKNKLIWGDNLLVMGSLLEKFAGKVDLIYIDPPFATGADFSVTGLIGDQGNEIIKEASAIEEKAYRDTWGEGLSSYLDMLKKRLVLIRELLTETGVLYLHIGPDLSHYVRLVAEDVFGANGYLNEIIWKRTPFSGSSKARAKKFPVNHDSIFFFAKRDSGYAFEHIYEEYSEEYKARFKYKDDRGMYRKTLLKTYSKATEKRLKEEDRWIEPVRASANPSYKQYLHESKGRQIEDIWGSLDIDDEDANGNVWEDLNLTNPMADERTGYPTQKPEVLLERIINASSRPGDLVADFFCGSGTTLAVAEKLGRRWIGCDLGRWAVHVTRKRLLGIKDCKPFEVLNLGKYERQYWQGVTFGEKKDKHLTEQALYEYLAFVLKLYGAQPVAGLLHLHGKKGRAMVHIGAVDAPVTIAEIDAAVEECGRLKQPELHVLGWEWEMGLYDLMVEAAKKKGVKLVLLQIPREVMEQQAAAKGDVRFFELAYLEAEIQKPDIRPGIKFKKGDPAVQVALKDFVIPNTELIPEEVRSKIKKWSDYIDYWAVDWDFQNDTFMQGWVAFRTRKERKLPLVSDSHIYDKPGKHRILVKVIDIFGNDTSQALDVEVPLP